MSQLAQRGFIRQRDIALLREIYRVNPMLFVFVTLRVLRLPATELQLPAAVFSTAREP
ncbi:MAG TPA: hypothetical protein VK110_10990 [Salinisphaeraceae bacterium]|nr:hypothetical protein [Salinisphaeraceae bacterium]